MNPPVEENVNSMEQKTRVFCLIYVQEFHLRQNAACINIKRKDIFYNFFKTAFYGLDTEPEPEPKPEPEP